MPTAVSIAATPSTKELERKFKKANRPRFPPALSFLCRATPEPWCRETQGFHGQHRLVRGVPRAGLACSESWVAASLQL